MSASCERSPFTCRAKVHFIARMSASCAAHLLLIAVDACLRDCQRVLHDRLAQLSIWDGVLTERLDELREDLSADDKADALLVYHGIDERVQIRRESGLIGPRQDFRKQGKKGGCLVFLSKVCELS